MLPNNKKDMQISGNNLGIEIQELELQSQSNKIYGDSNFI